jgi:hypothetical protein
MMFFPTSWTLVLRASPVVLSSAQLSSACDPCTLHLDEEKSQNMPVLAQQNGFGPTFLQFK